MEIKTLKYITISSFFNPFSEELKLFNSFEWDFCFGTNDYSLISKTRFVNSLFAYKEYCTDIFSAHRVELIIEKALILPDDIYIDLEN